MNFGLHEIRAAPSNVGKPKTSLHHHPAGESWKSVHEGLYNQNDNTAGSDFYSPRAIWQVLVSISSAWLRGYRVVAIIADNPVSGTAPPLSAFDATTCDGSAKSRSVRRAWWQVCDAHRTRVRRDSPTAVHETVALLQQHGIVHVPITFSMDGQLQRAGVSNVVELQGRLEHVRCRGCGVQREWPPVGIWRIRDLHCRDCGGLMMPGPPSAREIIETTRCSVSHHFTDRCVLLVIGTLQDSRVARMIFGEARARKARIVSITPSTSSTWLRTGDILVRGEVSQVMKAMAGLLIASRLAAGLLKGTAHPAVAESRGDRK